MSNKNYLYLKGVANSFSTFDSLYKSLLYRIISFGEHTSSRGMEVLAVYNVSMDLDVSLDIVPALQLRKMPLAKIAKEFLFDIGQSSNIASLGSAKLFWEAFADENGDLGASSYNRFFRRYPSVDSLEPNEYRYGSDTIDQIQKVIDTLNANPDSRRAVIFNGHPGFQYPPNGIPPCHPLIVFTPTLEGLNMTLTARSNDIIFGVPLDLIRYTMLLRYVCQRTNMPPNRLFLTSANTHLYVSNKEDAAIMLNRTSDTPVFMDDEFKFTNYIPYPHIKFTLATPS